jgi:hypothetical protein
MILSVLLLIVLLIIAYFHYLEGFFSSAMSAIMAAVAAIVAVAYHEAFVTLLLRGKFADQAHAITLVCLFAITYLILRLIFDKAIPGNLRFPVILDKVGAGVMGILAGLFGVGVLAIALQSLPFGPSIGGYSRYTMTFDKPADIAVAERSQIQNTFFDELRAEDFLNNTAQSLWVPADSAVLALVSHVSDAEGSLSAGRPFATTHPDYLQELFGQRVGIQSGSKHTATAGKTTVGAAFTAPSFPQQDQERLTNGSDAIGIRGKGAQEVTTKLPPVKKPADGKTLLVLRTTFHRDDADAKTSLFAFTPASIRLVANRVNYFPIGTLEGGRVLYVNAPDDLLFVPADKGADLVFEVDDSAVLSPVDPANRKASRKIKEGIFLEAKRLSRVPLEDIEVKAGVDAPPADQIEVVRKTGVPGAEGMTGTRGGEASAAKDATLAFADPAAVSNKLPNPINVGTAKADDDGLQNWGTFTIKGRKFSRLEVDATESVQRMGSGPNPISEFASPPGETLVQVVGRPSPDNPDKWAWAGNLFDYTLVDGSGKRYNPVGALAKVTNADGQNMLVVRFDIQKSTKSIPPAKDTRPTDVTLLYLVPSGTEIKSLDFKEGVLKAMQLKVP